MGVAYWSLFATLAKCHFIPHYAVFIYWRRLNICTEKKEIFVGLGNLHGPPSCSVSVFIHKPCFEIDDLIYLTNC